MKWILKTALSLLLSLVLIISLLGCGILANRTGSSITGADSGLSVKVDYNSYTGPNGTWAIYWYLCGSNLESDFGCATSDLREMSQVTLPGEVTVVIETGGANEWKNPVVDPASLQRYTYTGNEMQLVDTRPSANMGDPNTFAEFLNYCNKNYPAEHQVVILWDHGAGSLGGMESDERYGDDLLSLPEFKRAIEAMPAASGAYEIVGFDACLMATIDMVDILDGDARYLVASEESEPGNGWDYTGIFAALAKDTRMNGAEFGKVICDTFQASCEASREGGEVTLSVVDLSRADALVKAYDDVGKEALLGAVARQQDFISEFGRAAYSSENYGILKGSEVSDFEMVDMGDLVRNAGDLLPQSGGTLLDTLDEAVVYQVKGPFRTKASGLSCYFGYSGTEDSYTMFSTLSTSTAFRYFYEYRLKGDLSKEGKDFVASLSTQIQAPEELPSTAELGLSGAKPVYDPQYVKWALDIGPEAGKDVAAVYSVMSYRMEAGAGGADSVTLIELGYDTDMRLFMDRGYYVNDFGGYWYAIDGQLVYVRASNLTLTPEGGYVMLSVPVLLNGEEYTLRVAFNWIGSSRESAEGETYEILGAWKPGDEDSKVASKELRQIKPGDVIEPLFFVNTFDPDTGELTDSSQQVFGEIVVTEDTKFSMEYVGDGLFGLIFKVVDYSGGSSYSDLCWYRMQDYMVQAVTLE